MSGFIFGVFFSSKTKNALYSQQSVNKTSPFSPYNLGSILKLKKTRNNPENPTNISIMGLETEQRLPTNKKISHLSF